MKLISEVRETCEKLYFHSLVCIGHALIEAHDIYLGGTICIMIKGSEPI